LVFDLFNYGFEKGKTVNQKQTSSGLFPMGPVENLLREVYAKFDGDSATGIVLRVRGHIHQDIMQKVLLLLQQRHPKLCCGFACNSSGIHCFKVFDSYLPIPLIVQNAPTNDFRWQNATQSVLYPPMDVEKGPLLRLKILRYPNNEICDLLMGFHHSILDGVSVFRFVRELFSTYETIVNNKSLPLNIPQLPMITGQPLPVTAPIASRMRIILSLASSFLRRRTGRWTKLPVSSEPYAPLLTRYIFGEKETDSLLKQCRKHRISLTGAMFASGVIGLKKLLTQNGIKFACRFPIDLRRAGQYNVDSGDLFCLASSFMKVYPIQPEINFFDLARQSRTDLKKFINDQGPIMAANLSRFLKIKSGRRPRLRDTLSIDNLGIFNVQPQYGNLRIEEFSVFSWRRWLGVSLLVVFSTLHGRLNITFDGADLPQDFFSNFQDQFLFTLKHELQI
jgi:NRPS condensation-like uncharacterized protein